MSKRPFFTVLVAAFNSELTISDCLNSVLNQDFTDFELIFVDDCSSDMTLSLAKNILSKFPKFLCISNHTNLGLTASLNIGLSHARGRYIARLDADDISFPNRLNVASILHLKGFDIVGSSALVLSPKYSLNSSIFSQDFISFKPINNFITNPFVHSSVSFCRLDPFSDPIYYNEYFLKAQDFELWNRLHSLNMQSCFIFSPNCARSNLVNSISNKYYISQRYYAFLIRFKYYPFSLFSFYYNIIELLCILYCFLGFRRLRFSIQKFLKNL